MPTTLPDTVSTMEIKAVRDTAEQIQNHTSRSPLKVGAVPSALESIPATRNIQTAPEVHFSHFLWWEYSPEKHPTDYLLLENLKRTWGMQGWLHDAALYPDREEFLTQTAPQLIVVVYNSENPIQTFPEWESLPIEPEAGLSFQRRFSHFLKEVTHPRWHSTFKHQAHVVTLTGNEPPNRRYKLLQSLRATLQPPLQSNPTVLRLPDYLMLDTLQSLSSSSHAEQDPLTTPQNPSFPVSQGALKQDSLSTVVYFQGGLHPALQHTSRLGALLSGNHTEHYNENETPFLKLTHIHIHHANPCALHHTRQHLAKLPGLRVSAYTDSHVEKSLQNPVQETHTPLTHSHYPVSLQFKAVWNIPHALHTLQTRLKKRTAPVFIVTSTLEEAHLLTQTIARWGMPLINLQVVMQHPRLLHAPTPQPSTSLLHESSLDIAIVASSHAPTALSHTTWGQWFQTLNHTTTVFWHADEDYTAMAGFINHLATAAPAEGTQKIVALYTPFGSRSGIAPQNEPVLPSTSYTRYPTPHEYTALWKNVYGLSAMTVQQDQRHHTRQRFKTLLIKHLTRTACSTTQLPEAHEMAARSASRRCGECDPCVNAKYTRQAQPFKQRAHQLKRFLWAGLLWVLY